MSEEIKMSDLVEKLNNATLAYEEGNPVMSDQEWDNLYFILQKAEKISGVYLNNSPTQKIIYEVKNSLEKKEHNHKMLSLDKTKDLNEINSFLNNQDFIAMCKMDGLTCSLHYIGGKLISAETRGNGLIGEDILHNALVIKSIPNRISYTDELIIDGEIICDYDNFENFKDEYKNPRNFAAGSIRLLDSKECEKRKLSFVAWDVIKGFDEIKLLSEKLNLLKEYNFTVVPILKNTFTKIDNTFIEILRTVAFNYKYPIDGIVFKFNDIEYGVSLGETSHHFKNAIAFKFYDETYSTKLINIEWTMGRTGALTPVAIFEPIEIDGTIVERASMHNINTMYDTIGKLPWIGQKIEVFKAGMIIPQIFSAEKDEQNTEKKYLTMPEKCPVCGHKLILLYSNSGTITLECQNQECNGKIINRLEHFCGKKGLDIKGLSKATLEKLIDWEWINNLSDIFNLSQYKKEWINKTGFGIKSVENILNAIEDSKNTSLEVFISSLGIPLIGSTVSKELVKHIDSYEDFKEKIDSNYNFSKINGFADSKTTALLNFDYTEADKVYKYLNIENKAMLNNELLFQNTIFVITGRLNIFKNRDELIKKIESLGGKVTNAVTKNTNYLINNDNTSTSSKNVTANKLNIPIITEQDFITLVEK